MTPSFSGSSYLSDTDDREMWLADDTDEPSEDMRQEIRKLSNLFVAALKPDEKFSIMIRIYFTYISVYNSQRAGFCSWWSLS